MSHDAIATTAITPAAGAIHLDADIDRLERDGLRLDPFVERVGRDEGERVFDLPIARPRSLDVLSVGSRRPIVSIVPSVSHHPDAYDHASGADEHGNEAKDRSHRCPP
jgi:hypothetical protein